MSITNPNVGLQADADTLALYKSIREANQVFGALGIGVYTQANGVLDSSGNGYHLTGLGIGPDIADGPLGPAGWNRAAPQFARRFNSSTSGQLRGEPIDQALNDAIRGTFTQQYLIKLEFAIGTIRGIAAAAQNVPDTGVQDDWLARVSLRADGGIQLFWESEDADQIVDITGAHIIPAKWQVITVAWTPGAGTGYDIETYLHTLDSPGVVVGGLIDTQVDFGTRPVEASGVGDSRIVYGGDERDGPATWIGDIAFGRILKARVADIAGEAEELLLTGELAVSVANDLFRHEMNEPPTHVDESGNGLHCKSGMIIDYGAGVRHIDLLGSGGRAFRSGESYALINGLVANESLKAKYGISDRLVSFFNDDDIAVPAYTLQFWGRFAGSGDFLICDHAAAGESEATNAILNFGLTAAGDLTLTTERGGGVNNTRTSVVGSWDNSLGVTEQPMLLTIRADESAPASGVQRFRISLNDDLDVLTYNMTGVAGGGEAAVGLRWGWPNLGQLQEFKISTVAISDAQVLADAARWLPTIPGATAGPVTPAAIPMGIGPGGIPFLPEPSA